MNLTPIRYEAIGSVESPIREPKSPEEMRGVPARLVLQSHYKKATESLQPGQHIWVIFHLHQVGASSSMPSPDLFTRRIAARPNPIGITLVRVLSTQDAVINVIGLDAVQGTPILDIKPYKPIWDEPPVEPSDRDVH